ncbi:MAG: hypothetical protein A4E35_00539 [Methanoregula sp. PtaU1.Bin051]|nr:MAG: hypothetical protein A4E35_00539 [Methanoregula sp. PtaU1.Bin051]
MGFPDPETELAVLKDKERTSAFIRLLVTVLLIDAVAIAGYLVLVYQFGWDGMTAFIPLLVTAIITGAYYQAKNREIRQR